MLATAARHGFDFDTVQMPLNVMDAHFHSFEKSVLPVAVGEVRKRDDLRLASSLTGSSVSF